MRPLTAFILASVIVFADSAGIAVEKTDLQLLQGTWVVVRLESNGKNANDDKVKELGVTVTIKDRTLSKTQEGKTETANFVLRSTMRPKEIDAVPQEGEHKGETMLGIYSVDSENNFKLSLRGVGKKGRPTGFNTKTKSGDTTFIMKRSGN